MKSKEQVMQRRLGVCAIALSLLGCSAQAHVSAKVGSSGGGAQTAGAEALKPRESNWDKEAREEAEVASRGAPSHETGAVQASDSGASAENVPAPAGKGRRGKKHSRAKPKKHHENGAEIAAAPDHDRGHGNDLDGVDEDNPGKRKKK
jgi:hypothetical protein